MRIQRQFVHRRYCTVRLGLGHRKTCSTRAAIDGFGVMMGTTQLLTDEIDVDSLVAPFKTAAAAEFGHYLVYRPSAVSVAKVSAAAQVSWKHSVSIARMARHAKLYCLRKLGLADLVSAVH